MKGKLWLEGAGVGIVLTLGMCWNQLSSTHIYLYHRLLPATTVVRATAIDLVLASVVGAALLWLFEYFDSKGKTLLWGLLGAFLASRLIGGLIVNDIVLREGVTPGRAFLIAAIFFLALYFLLRRFYAPVIAGMRGALLLLGICIFWMLPVLVVLGMAKQPWDQESFRKPVDAKPLPHRRIVWLLFDELSWDQTYEHRWPGLDMPNFDRLRASSVGFSQVEPDGMFTELVIPSLFLGTPIDSVVSTSQGWPMYRGTPRGPWTRFDGNATFFADAQRSGWTTAAAGSYNPYCRILQAQIDSCMMQLPFFTNHMSREHSTLGNVFAPVEALWNRTFHSRFDSRTYFREVTGMTATSQEFISDEGLDFVFLHLPVPHPPGAYNRRTGRLALGGSYIDNLALSDKMLGELLGEIDQTQSASMTTVIISSDHSWRIPIWRGNVGWTREDEQASQGRFDQRPFLMVHFAGETAQETITQPFSLLKEHDLVEMLLRGPMDAAELQGWVQAQRSDETPVRAK